MLIQMPTLFIHFSQSSAWDLRPSEGVRETGDFVGGTWRPGNRGIPRAPTPLIPLPQDLLGPETTAVPVEPKTSNASPPRVSGSPSSQERP